MKVRLFKETTGLNNVIDPVRHEFDPVAGIRNLSAAVNVDIDASGRPHLRKGYVKIRPEPTHSIWAKDDLCFLVSGDSMYRMLTDFSRVGLRSGLTPGLPMSYVEAGGWVYYANGRENGVNRDGGSWSWVGDPLIGPETTREITNVAPIGHLLEIFNGYMLIAVKDRIYWSLPFAFSHYRLGTDFYPFSNETTMMKAVSDGVWVSDAKATYFLAGPEPSKWGKILKATYPAIRGTDVIIDGQNLLDGSMDGVVAMWTTPKGICVGGSQGTFRNLTIDRLSYPLSTRGAGLATETKYVCTMAP